MEEPYLFKSICRGLIIAINLGTISSQLFGISPSKKSKQFSFEKTICKNNEILTPPLKQNLRISGSFGEYRRDHFHLGVDFRVDGKIGLPVVAPKPGEIYALGFAQKGYGLHLTLKHSDGTYSLFAHLDQISEIFWTVPELNEFKKKFTEKEDFFISLKDLEIEKTKILQVKRGDIIAFTGETGSGPPHLHFEYKNKKGWPVNPFSKCGLVIQDQRTPVFTRLFIIPVDNKSGISGKRPLQGEKKFLEITPIRIKKNHFILRKTIKAFGKIKLKVAGFDNANTDNALGFYSLSLLVNKKKIYSVYFNQLDPKRSHRMGLVYDLENTSYSGITYVYRLYTEVAKALAEQQGEGILELSNKKKKIYKITILAGDTNKNVSKLTFRVQSIPAKEEKKQNYPKHQKNNLWPDKESKFFLNQQKVSLFFPKNSVLSATRINLSGLNISPELPQGMEPVFPIFDLRPRDQYIEKPYILKFPVFAGKTDFPVKKMGVYHIQERTHKIFLLSKVAKDAKEITIKNRQLGLIGLLKDNSPPTWIGPHFNPYHIYRPEDLVPAVYVKDTGLGIDPKSIEAFLDNKKVKALYNPNRKWIFLNIDLFKISNGRHKIFLKVKDLGGNDSELYKSSFKIRQMRIAFKEKYLTKEKITKTHLKKKQIFKKNKNFSFFPKKTVLGEANVLASVDNIIRIMFPPYSLRSWKKIYIKRVSLNKVKGSIRWNMRGEYLYYLYIPYRALKKPFRLSFHYADAAGDKKTSLVRIRKGKLYYEKSNYSPGLQTFNAQKITRGGLFGIYYDDAPPLWGKVSFQEKKIYEKHNIPLSVYIFDSGLGIDPKSIKAKIDDTEVFARFNKRRNKIVIVTNRKKLLKGFRRLRIQVMDYAGNPAIPLSKYFIIRYKPRWRWN